MIALFHVFFSQCFHNPCINFSPFPTKDQFYFLTTLFCFPLLKSSIIYSYWKSLSFYGHLTLLPIISIKILKNRYCHEIKEMMLIYFLRLSNKLLKNLTFESKKTLDPLPKEQLNKFICFLSLNQKKNILGGVDENILIKWFQYVLEFCLDPIFILIIPQVIS